MKAPFLYPFLAREEVRKVHVTVEKSYYDEQKCRNIGAGEEIQVTEERKAELEALGVLKKEKAKGAK